MPITVGQDTAKTRKTLSVNGKSISYYSIPAATDAGYGDFTKLPAALKVVLENLLRFEDGGFSVSTDDIKAFSDWPTIPQLYVKGEFVGGSDIMMEMFEAGEMQALMDEKQVAKAEG